MDVTEDMPSQGTLYEEFYGSEEIKMQLYMTRV